MRKWYTVPIPRRALRYRYQVFGKISTGTGIYRIFPYVTCARTEANMFDTSTKLLGKSGFLVMVWYQTHPY